MSKKDTAPTKTEIDAPQETSIGVSLQRLREEKGLSIQHVSQETYISASNLLAIENEDFAKLPADTFIRGQIVLYGDYLGTDGAGTARSFFLERDKKLQNNKKIRHGKQESSMSAKKLAEPAQVSSATFAGILLLLVIISATAFCMYTGWNPFAYFLTPEPPIAPPYSETITAEEPEYSESDTIITSEQKQQYTATTLSTENTNSSASEQPLIYTLTALFTRDSGIDIIIDDQEPVHLQGKKGEQQQWQAARFIQLSFEYPDSATITVNDAALSFPTRNQDGKATLILPEDLPSD